MVDSVARQAIQQPRPEPAVPLKDRFIAPQFSIVKFFALSILCLLPGIIYVICYCNYKKNIEETAEQLVKELNDVCYSNHPDFDTFGAAFVSKLADIATKCEKIPSAFKFWILGLDDEAIRINLAFALVHQEKNFLERGNQNAFVQAQTAFASASNEDPDTLKQAKQLIDTLISFKDALSFAETGRLPQAKSPEPSVQVLEPVAALPVEQPVLSTPAPVPVEPPLLLPTVKESFIEHLGKSECPHVRDFLSSLISKSTVETASYDPKTGEFSITFDQPYTIYLASLTDGAKGVYVAPDSACNQLRFEKTVQGKIQKLGDKEVITFTPKSGSIPVGFGMTANLPPISYTTVNGQKTAALKLPVIGDQQIPLTNFKGVMSASYMQPKKIAFNANNLMPQYRLG